MSRRLAMGTIIAIWSGVAVVAFVFAPDRSEELVPEVAEMVYGDSRSSLSSGSDGVLAFARILERLGVQPRVYRDVSLPSNGVLAVLAPVLWYTDAEADRVVDWIRGGGRLLYATREITVETDDDLDVVVEDPIVARLFGSEQKIGGTVFEQVSVGRGRAVVLFDGGRSITNEAVFDSRLADATAWMNFLFEGESVIHFDEVRSGVMQGAGLIDTLLQTRYAPLLIVAAIVFLLLAWAGFPRLRPAQAAAPSPRRDLRGYLASIAEGMQHDGRRGLAMRLMTEGCRRRLGPIARVPDEFSDADHKGDLVVVARKLSELEAKLCRSRTASMEES